MWLGGTGYDVVGRIGWMELLLKIMHAMWLS